MNSLVTDLAQQFASSLIGTLVLFSALYFGVNRLLERFWPQRRIQLTKQVNASQIAFEVKHTALALFVNIFLSGGLLYLDSIDIGRIYDATGENGWAYELFVIGVLFVVSDAWFYWVHRSLHHPTLYKYIHAVHHRSRDVNVFTSYSFHWVEALANTFFIVPLFFVMPMSAGALGIVQGIGLFNNIKSHFGYELYPRLFRYPPFNLLITSTNHNLHHTEYDGNFGLHTRVWDLLFGTEIPQTRQTFRAVQDRGPAAIEDNTQYLELTIAKIERETSDSCSVHLAPSDPRFFQFIPGQYLDMRFEIDSRTHHRLFSLSSTPNDDLLRITVRLNGTVTHHLFDDARPGDTVESLLPMGGFSLGEFSHRPSTDPAHRTLFVAGGSGITPIFSMIRARLEAEPDAAMTLFYANRSPASSIFLDELDDLARAHEGFTLVNFFDSKDQRISKADLELHLAAHPDTEIFVCGPTGLKDAVTTHARELDVPGDALHSEGYADGFVPRFGLLA